jgi:NitT/TauT family transport system permease protein
MPARALAGAERWFAPAVALLLVGGWEAAARAGAVSALFFPAPSFVLSRIASLTASGELLAHLLATLQRVGLGFLLGALAGLPLGLLMGWSPRVRRAVDPLVAALHPMPKVAIMPLLMLLLGLGEAPKLAVVATATFFPFVVNASAGVRQIGHAYFEVAESYGASPLRIFRRIVLPGSLPFVLAGARLALNTSLLLTIAVELISATRGLGRLVWLSWQTMRTEDLYATIVVMAALGVAMNLSLAGAAALFVPWQRERLR